MTRVRARLLTRVRARLFLTRVRAKYRGTARIYSSLSITLTLTIILTLTL